MACCEAERCKTTGLWLGQRWEKVVLQSAMKMSCSAFVMNSSTGGPQAQHLCITLQHSLAGHHGLVISSSLDVATVQLPDGCLSCANQATHCDRSHHQHSAHCDMDTASPGWRQQLVAACSDMAMASPGLRHHCDMAIISHHLSKKK